MSHLPLWFLILAIFLPRVSLIIGYFLDILLPFGLHGWMPPTLAVLVPRALVLILIFQDRGMSGWLLVHALAMAAAYIGGSRRSGRRKKQN